MVAGIASRRGTGRGTRADAATRSAEGALPRLSSDLRSLRFLIADLTLCRAGIRALLETFIHPAAILEARNGQEAVAMCVRHRPDIAILEALLPGLNGFETAARIARRAPSVRVMLLSRVGGRDIVARTLHAGAAGLITKDLAPADFVQAIRTAARGGTWVGPGTASVPSAGARTLKQFRRGEGEVLTGRQREILQLVAEGWSSKEIGRALGVSQKTVETHRADIMRRLDLRDVAGMVRYAIRVGIVTP